MTSRWVCTYRTFLLSKCLHDSRRWPVDKRARAQAKLGVPEEEFVKWRFAFMVNLRQPEYLEDEDVVALRFARQSATHGVSTETSYLGLEHADTGPKRPHPNSNRFSQYERPVKIYN